MERFTWNGTKQDCVAKHEERYELARDQEGRIVETLKRVKTLCPSTHIKWEQW
jgi:hypothetical protein